MGAARVGHGGGAARRRPGHRDRPRRRPARRADGARRGRPRRRRRPRRDSDAPATVLRALLDSGADDGSWAPCTRAGCARTTPTRSACSAPTARRRVAGVRRRARRRAGGRGARRPRGRRRPARLRADRGGQARGPRPDVDVELPAPLAEPRLDFRVDKASALAYEVREGEYIQIIDVQGKQCSDFLAFHRAQAGARARARPRRRHHPHADGRGAYPPPGIYRKFFDVDMDPLVEVVRDTVGRHDTFGLACTPKYYEDMGYPGHINCTENFNGQVTPYGIAERSGWEAVNFFYNTGLRRDNLLIVDEPWSRPGDYVLLRAMTDLVCASSACPDDIDPANAWEMHRHPRARLLAREPLLDGDRPSRDPGGRASADQGDRLPPAHQRAHEELHGLPRLLAAPVLRHRGRDQPVLGVPRAGGRDGPLAAAQVGGPRARTRRRSSSTPSPATSAAWRSARSCTPRSATRPAA